MDFRENPQFIDGGRKEGSVRGQVLAGGRGSDGSQGKYVCFRFLGDVGIGVYFL